MKRFSHVNLWIYFPINIVIWGKSFSDLITENWSPYFYINTKLSKSCENKRNFCLVIIKYLLISYFWSFKWHFNQRLSDLPFTVNSNPTIIKSLPCRHLRVGFFLSTEKRRQFMFLLNRLISLFPEIFPF